jgi:hypothetical protein
MEEERRQRGGSKHRQKFLADNRDLIPVLGSKDEELLRWAVEKNLVKFTKFEGEEFYRAEDVDIAKMWKEKHRDGVPIED